MLLLDESKPNSFRNVESMVYTLGPSKKDSNKKAYIPNSHFLSMSQYKLYDRTDLIRGGLNDIYTSSRKKP